MPPFATVKASNTSVTFSSKPVAIFVGGTSGIGQERSIATAKAFARYTQGNAHIILVGRNESAALSTIASFPQTPSSTYEFLPCNVSLMSDITSLVSSLKSRTTTPPITKVNYLFFTAGGISFDPRTETTEGIDKKMSLDFYARWHFVLQLLPLMEVAKASGEEARVVNVLAAGKGRPINFDDMELKKAYKPILATSTCVTYTENMTDEFASRHPSISFVHMYPGLVATQGLTSGGVSSSFFLKIVGYLLWPFSTSSDVFAEYAIHALLAPDFSTGAHHLGPRADAVPTLFVNSEGREKVYQHLIDTVGK